jgi:hypothetical protein
MNTAPGRHPAAPPPPRRPPGDPQWSTPGRPVAGMPWSPSSMPAGERATRRVRKIAEGLPDWEPLPPGETVVRRPGGTA